jgi:CubicO group peptidase (beta-lactamase class C family)
LNESTGSLHDARTKSLRTLIKGFADRDEVPGVSLLVAQNGRVVFREAYGVADLETKKPFTVDTMVLTASATKPISATAVMTSVDEGKLSLDDKASKYLPGFETLSVAKTGEDAPSPTVRQLLSHTSGLYGLVGATKSGMRAVRDLSLTLSESVDIISEEELVDQPGARFNYGGANYQVAARLVEITAGQPFDRYLEDHLFRKLNMHETYFRPRPQHDKSRVATVYRLAPQKGLVPIPAYEPDPGRKLILASGGLYSSLNDLAIFLQMHLNGGIYGGSRILSGDAMAEMHRKQTGNSKAQYGLGWFRERVTANGHARSINHPGLFGALIWIDKDRDLVGVLFTSVLWPERKKLHNALHEKILELFSAG